MYSAVLLRVCWQNSCTVWLCGKHYSIDSVLGLGVVCLVSLSAMNVVKLFKEDVAARKRLAELLAGEHDVKLAIIGAVLKEVATKTNIDRLRRELRGEIEKLRSESREEIGKLRGEFKSNIERLSERSFMVRPISLEASLRVISRGLSSVLAGLR